MNIKNIMLSFFLAFVACTPITDAKPDAGADVIASAPAPTISLPQIATPELLPEVARLPTTMEVHFSPNGGCTDMIVKRVAQGKKVRVLAYTFTSAPIIQQLIASKNAGVDVRVVLDRSDAGTSGLQQLQAASVPVKLDKMHVIAHNKVVVIDDQWVLTGSFNFTYAAEHQNAENCLAINNKALAALYAANWDLHNGHAVTP